MLVNKLACLGSITVEKLEASNCFCVYPASSTVLSEFFSSRYLQEKPAHLCLQNKSHIWLHYRWPSSYGPTCNTFIHLLSHSWHMLNFERREHDTCSIGWQSESFCVNSLVRETFRHSLHHIEDRLKTFFSGQTKDPRAGRLKSRSLPEYEGILWGQFASTCAKSILCRQFTEVNFCIWHGSLSLFIFWWDHLH